MKIALAHKEDLPIVRLITQTTIRAVYPRYYPKGAVDFFTQHHSDEHIAADIAASRVYLLWAETEPVGTVTIADNNINRLFVLPEHQHQGYGKKLLDFAEEKILENYDCIQMDASLPAKAIYLKRGYKETEYHIIETENGDWLCYDVMKREKHVK